MKNCFFKKIKKRGIVLLAIIMVTACTVLFASGCFLESLVKPDINSCFEISDVEMVSSYTEEKGYSVKLTGKAKIKYRDFAVATLTYNVYDADKNNLGEVSASYFGLNNGSIWTFSATSDEFFATKPVTYELLNVSAIEAIDD